MSGSASKTERETEGSSPNASDRTSLADFLAPPRSRASGPAPARADGSESDAEPAADEAATRADEDRLSESEASVSAAEAPTPTEPTTLSEPPRAAEPVTAIRGRETVSDAPSSAEPVTGIRGREPIPSVAPPSVGDASARSLIPVATSDSDVPQEELDDFELPGSGPLTGASLRRVTYVALLAAAAAVPAWVVFRARSVDVQRAESPAAKVTTASAGPTTIAPAREIEGDDDEANEPAEPPPQAVAVDPIKAAEARREARRLLEGGQIDPGVAAARNAIALDPANAESYVLLAAGLQDQGRWAESREVFSRCIHKSNNAINAECVYFATSGTITNR
jgi:hypothetical protein